MNGSSGVVAKTVLLHIGTMKTGNTSIHHRLAQAQAQGELGTVCYPRWNGEAHQSRLAVLYCPDSLDQWPSVRQRYPASERRFRRIREQYRESTFAELRSSSSAILSAETFGHLFTARHAAALREDLESLGFSEFRIVLYVRDPADYYLSVAQQSLRMSDIPPLIKDPGRFKYDFLPMARTWEQVFPGRLIVRSFPADPNHDVVDDFRFLLQQHMGVALHRIPMRKNTTVSAEGMQILQEYRDLSSDSGGVFTTDADRLASLLGQLRNDVTQTAPKLKPEVAEQIRANHKADAEMLESRFGIDLGWRDWGPASALPRRELYRVEDIVESVNPDIVNQLLLRVVREELGRRSAKRSLPLRVAARAYHSIPAAHRPERLVARLRSLT